ncbi:OmpA family protein, partial [Lentzea sp.]|uniref:OmpA family protein n=1 Tax=Lentzea sp. TaxID=56099 RepID=UPI002ED1421E
QRLCEATGVRPENCAIETGSVVGKSPQRPPSGDMSDPEVAFPAPEDGVDGEKEIVWALGDSDLVLFDFDSDRLKREGVAQLEKVAAKIKEYPRASTMISGHTDSRGTNEYNLGLSQRRAEAVRAVLRNSGVTTNIETRWFGEEKPLCPNSDDEQAMKCNRRVEIVTNKGW